MRPLVPTAAAVVVAPAEIAAHGAVAKVKTPITTERADPAGARPATVCDVADLAASAAVLLAVVDVDFAAVARAQVAVLPLVRRVGDATGAAGGLEGRRTGIASSRGVRR